MKKLFIAILAAILCSGAFAQQSFPDIPEGHWAGDAVDRIADLSIVIGFPDGTFRGNEAFTRYQAALVISRLLDVIAEDMDAALAMTNEDIASLRNAVQELSSDVAAQGTRLSAAEGAIAGLSDDVTGQAARLDELEAALADMDLEIDPAVLRDLQNQIASQRVAADTAQATADEALARANAAGSLAEANAAEIAALNDLIQLLGDQIEALQGMGGEEFDATGLEGRIARNEGDIANIREFVILLRRDQVALRDRVSALEASDEQQNADIADLQDRVTAIEQNPLGLSGTLAIEYFTASCSGACEEFDVDRAYGVGMPRSMGPSTFSSGDDGGDEEAEDLVDIEYGTDFDRDIDLTLGAGSVFGSAGVSGLNSFEATLTIALAETDIDLFDLDDDIPGVDTPGFAFYISDAAVSFETIGGASLQFQFGLEVDAFFTPYTLNVEDESGFVATFDPGDMLAFLDPTLQVAYLTGAADTGPDDEFVTLGARLTLSPLEGFNVGVSYVMNTVGEEGVIDAATLDDTIFGVDLQAALGPVILAAEYASATVEETGFADDVLFVTADTEFDILGGVSFSANYRDIADDWEANVASGVELTDDDDYPFEEDQAGFAVEAGLGLFIFDIGVFYDTYVTTDPAATTTAFGVDAAAELFAGFALTAFYEQVTIDGAIVDDNDATERDNAYRTGFGVGLIHDPEAPNALIPGLGLEFAYEQLGAGFDETHILASAEYTLDVSIVQLTPYVTYETFNDLDAGSDDTVTLAAGTGLVTQPLDIFFQPNLEAAVNYRTTAHTDVAGDPDYTATEMQWSVGLNLNAFLLENSTLSARYGSYTGTNVDYDTPSEGDEFTGGATGSVSGYEIVWNYYDLEFSYGGYTNTDMDGDTTFAAAFGVSYSVEF